MEFPQKRKVFQWRRDDEIILMKEVAADRPSTTGGWEKVALNVNLALNSPNAISGRAAKDHTNVVLRNFRTEDSKALKRSGTEEQYTELCQLCQDVTDFVRDVTEAEKKKKEEQAKKKDSKEDDNERGLAMRDAAMKRLAEKKENSSNPKKQRRGLGDLMELIERNQQLKSKELELEERRVALREKEVKQHQELLQAHLAKR